MLETTDRYPSCVMMGDSSGSLPMNMDVMSKTTAVLSGLYARTGYFLMYTSLKLLLTARVRFGSDSSYVTELVTRCR